MMQLKLNTLNLNTGWYSVQELEFDSAPAIEFSDMSFAAGDGAKFITSKFTPKTITIRGRITQSTVALLEAEMDNFKKILLNNPNINLNFSFANGFRQYVGNIQSLMLTRKYFNITYVPFEITFVAGDPPFSQAIDNIDSVVPNLSEVFSADNITGNSYSHTLSFTGTAPPLAKWTYLLDAVSGRIQQMVFKSITTGKQMEINEAMSAGDEVIIDEESLDVLLNAFPQQYEGVFPSFNLGANELEWQIYGTNEVTSGLFVDQSNLSPTSGAYGIMEIGQIFTSGFSGVLGKASFLLKKNYTNTVVGTVKLYDISGGLPSAVLAQMTIDLSYLPVNQSTWVDFMFNYSSLVSGSQYAIVMSLTGDTYDIERRASRGDKYSGGGAVLKSGGYWYHWAVNDMDFAFKTYMTITSSRTFDHESSLKIEQKKRFI